MDRKSKLDFQQKLLKWHFQENKRVLPWKGETQVYKIWLSEIILQQTRTEQGWKYYERFLERFPSVQDLADASLDAVYKLWEGLGYYNRCRNLHATAQTIVTQYNGVFPADYESLLRLKGIGPYTAAAIASFAFQLPYAVVDGNVYRVLSRYFGIETPIDTASGKHQFQSLAQECLNVLEPAAYNQAIMDFGATVCKPDAPLCATCPLQKKCLAFKEKSVTHYPVKSKKVQQKDRWFTFYFLSWKGRYAVRKREQKDVWRSLYEFPSIEWKSEKEWERSPKSKTSAKLSDWLQIDKIDNVLSPKVQKLSHQTIHAFAVIATVSSPIHQLKTEWEWKTKAELKAFPFPRILQDFMDVQFAKKG
jgi:A/G-specific adenine glycosylase